MKEKPTNEIRKYWDNTARTGWGEKRPILDQESAIRTWIGTMLLKNLDGLKRAKTILDLGAGSQGQDLVAYLHDIHETVPGEIISFDISHEMLLRKPEALRVEGDLRAKLPFQNASVDFISSTFAMRYIRNHEELLEEIERILKPGGRFLIIDFSWMPVSVHARDFTPEWLLREAEKIFETVTIKELLPPKPASKRFEDVGTGGLYMMSGRKKQ